MKHSFWLIIIIIAFFSAVPAYAAENNITPPPPMIIAHRGGPSNWPPNTICAIRKDLQEGVDAIEIDVQISRDGDLVLYHPEDLAEQTTASGNVADKNTAELATLDTTAKYKGPKDYQTACKSEELRIPKLTDVLQRFPDTEFFIDLKSLPAEPLVRTIARKVPKAELKRLIFYSTNQEHLSALDKYIPRASHFENRAKTFDRLMTYAGTHQCTLPDKTEYVGFELFRDLDICEKFKLGGNCFKTSFEMWSQGSMACTKTITNSAKVILFGIDTPEAYEKALQLGAYGVYSNDPKTLLEYRTKRRSQTMRD